MITGIEDMVGINPDTGEFDINLVPESIREDVKRMAEGMIERNDVKKPKKKGCNRKKKKRVKTKKTYGINKKRKK